MYRNYRVFPGKISKCPDSRSNFGFVPKQRLLELSPPVLLAPSKRLLNREQETVTRCYIHLATHLRTSLHSQSHHALTNGYSIY